MYCISIRCHSHLTSVVIVFGFWARKRCFLAIYILIREKKVLMKKAVSTQFLTSTVNLSRIFDLFHNSWHSLSNIVKKRKMSKTHNTTPETWVSKWWIGKRCGFLCLIEKVQKLSSSPPSPNSNQMLHYLYVTREWASQSVSQSVKDENGDL